MAARDHADFAMRVYWAKWLLLGVLALPIGEIVVFVAVAAQIGFVNACLIQLVCSLAGIMVIRSAGRVRLDRLRSQFGEGMIRTAQLDGADLARLLAGVLLVVPGFLTDALGALLLVPSVRRGLGAVLRRAVAAPGGGAQPDRVIDLEPDEWERQESGVRDQVSGVRKNLEAWPP
jgi:UPF0716 protein FxsA